MADVTFSPIHVVDGQELGDTPQIFVQPAGKRAPRSGETLIVFLDLPNASAATCAEISRALSDGYWRAPGGLTTALRLAVKLGNDHMMELNRGAAPTQRVQGSISCAVINHESVVIAQAGPAIAFARSQAGAFERVTPVGDMSPAGTSRAIDAFFTHYAWKSGDAFILTGENSCRGVGDQLVNACMGKGDARLIAGYLNANVKQGRLTGVAFTVAGEPVELPAATPIAPAQEPAPATPAPTLATRPSRAQAATVAATPVTDEEPPKRAPVLGAVGEAAGAALGQAAGGLKRGLGSFSAQLLPAQTANTTPVQRSRATVFGLATAAILIPIVVSLLVAIGYLQFSGEAEKQQIINAALTQVDQARTSNTVDSWTKAVSLIKDYETKYPDDTTTFADAKRQAQAQMDQVSKISRVAATPIIDLGSSSAPRRIAASSIGIYILDEANNSAAYYVLSTQRNSISGKPVSLSAGSGVTLTGQTLADITWASTSGGRWRTEGALLFTKSTLYEYNSATAQMAVLNIPTEGGSAPSQVTAGDLYNNTAYLLDAPTGQIWRYTLQGSQLAKIDPYFRTGVSPLHDAIDIAIDGAIYTLQKNATVLKYFNRQQAQFSLSGLPQKLGKVAAIAVSGNDSATGNVFIGDIDSGAVWVFSKQGAFVKQFRGANDEFVGMQDISLDATSNTMYVNTATKLFSFKVS